MPERCLAVVMPCFNERATLEQIVDRVLASPFTAELLIVDDASTDGSREIAQKVAAGDGRGRAFEAPVNQGQGAAPRPRVAQVTAPRPPGPARPPAAGPPPRRPQ